eukprot:1227944-Prymnesium_polylepis.1
MKKNRTQFWPSRTISSHQRTSSDAVDRLSALPFQCMRRMRLVSSDRAPSIGSSREGGPGAGDLRGRRSARSVGMVLTPLWQHTGRQVMRGRLPH